MFSVFSKPDNRNKENEKKKQNFSLFIMKEGRKKYFCTRYQIVVVVAMTFI
jgi:hypothetical protein